MQNTFLYLVLAVHINMLHFLLFLFSFFLFFFFFLNFFISLIKILSFFFLMLQEGTEAPDFRLNDAKGKEYTLSQYKGMKVILYFYPKDDTTGCTKEACDFRDSIGIVTKKKAVILGISADSEDSHGKFTQNNSIFLYHNS